MTPAQSRDEAAKLHANNFEYAGREWAIRSFNAGWDARQAEIAQLRQLCEADNVALKKAQAKIAKMHELLERAENLIHEYAPGEDVWIQDYAALTEGEKK